MSGAPCRIPSQHLTTRVDSRVGGWAGTNNVEIAYSPTNSSWLNRIKAQFTALRYFALKDTDHHNHRAQASRIRELVVRLFGVEYSLPGVWLLLRRQGWSCQLPRRPALERDEEAIEVWCKEVWPRAKRSLR